MLTKILSISSVLLGIYLIIIFLKNADLSRPFSQPVQYHMGCFSSDNTLNHSISVRQYLANINSQNPNFLAQQQSFQLVKKINYNEISKGVARDFERYLNEYYQIKTKSLYEQNFYESLSVAENKFEGCKEEVRQSFDKNICKNTWDSFSESREKYEELRDALKRKIERKQLQEKKISAYILGTNYEDSQKLEKNITDQINAYNLELEDINKKKIEIVKQRSPLEIFISTNKSKLQQDQRQLDQCQKNMKIITFCNELTKELNTIKLPYSKQDVQTRIQRKKIIIEAFNKSLKNAQKLGDYQMAQMSRKNLQKNIDQLSLLEIQIGQFESFEESYCSKCTDEKIAQLRIEIERTKIFISTNTQKSYQLNHEMDKLNRQSTDISTRISELQDEKEIQINRYVCVDQQCRDQRLIQIKDQGRILNEMKKQVLDYKFLIEAHKATHQTHVAELNGLSHNLNEITDCLYRKQYYEALRERKPEHSQNEIMKIQDVKNVLIKKLNALTQ